MSKISNTTAYPTIAPADGDLLIGTDINDSNATKTFTIGSIVALAPADTLAEVLTAGNTATNNIILTGNITCTTIIPTNLQDAAGSTGAIGQHLVKNAANALEWGAGSADTLANVLAAGNTAANGITLTGATGIITSTVSVPADIRDNVGNFGTAGQTLKKSAANAIAWETVGDNTLAEVLTAGNTATNDIVLTGDINCTNIVPEFIKDTSGNVGIAGQTLKKSGINALAWETVGDNTLAEVLAAGNAATNNIVLTGDISCTNLTATAAISGVTVTGTTSITTPLAIPTDIQDTAAATGVAGQYLAKSAANALEWTTAAPGAAALAAVLAVGNTATNDIVLTGDFTGTGNITRTGTVTITGGIGASLSITSGADIEAVGFISADTYLKGKGTNALKLPNIQAFANEAAAAALTTGDVYQTDGTAVAPLNVAGILMVKQ